MSFWTDLSARSTATRSIEFGTIIWTALSSFRISSQTHSLSDSSSTYSLQSCWYDLCSQQYFFEWSSENVYPMAGILLMADKTTSSIRWTHLPGHSELYFMVKVPTQKLRSSSPDNYRMYTWRYRGTAGLPCRGGTGWDWVHLLGYCRFAWWRSTNVHLVSRPDYRHRTQLIAYDPSNVPGYELYKSDMKSGTWYIV